MLDPAHLKTDTYRVQKWKNGRGETREIAVDSAEPFRWRVSWATVSASTPFSSFPGYDRVLVVLGGGPVHFAHDGQPARPVSPGRSYTFRGDAKTVATVYAEAEDFNVFTRRGFARASVYPTEIAAGEEIQFPLAGQEHFVFGLEGRIELLEPTTGGSFSLGPRETFRVSRRTKQEYLNLRACGQTSGSRCLWVVIHLTER